MVRVLFCCLPLSNLTVCLSTCSNRVVGHTFIVYAPLLIGCASIFFEGKPPLSVDKEVTLSKQDCAGKPIIPDAGVWWRIVERYKVTGLFTAPTALRALRKEGTRITADSPLEVPLMTWHPDPEAKFLQQHNIKSLRTLYLAGERSEPQIVEQYSRFLRKYAG